MTLLNYNDLTNNQQEIVETIVRDTGWMDFDSYSSMRPQRGQDLLDFAFQLDSINDLTVKPAL